MDNTRVNMPQFDCTLDTAGTFWVSADWRKVYKRLKQALEDQFMLDLKDNGNSFTSCFQYEEDAKPDRPSMRIKVYNKLVSMI